MLLTLLGTVGFLVGLAVVVPLLAYGLSALLDRGNWSKGDEGQGGLRMPRRPGPSAPPAPAARSTESGERDGTVS